MWTWPKLKVWKGYLKLCITSLNSHFAGIWFGTRCWEYKQAEPKLQSVFWEIDVVMLRILVGFLIRLIGQHQRPNYPYIPHYRRNISPHRSGGLQTSRLWRMFFCTGCMEVSSWLLLWVVSKSTGWSNLSTECKPSANKKAEPKLRQCSFKNY